MGRRGSGELGAEDGVAGVAGEQPADRPLDPLHRGQGLGHGGTDRAGVRNTESKSSNSGDRWILFLQRCRICASITPCTLLRDLDASRTTGSGGGGSLGDTTLGRRSTLRETMAAGYAAMRWRWTLSPVLGARTQRHSGIFL